MNDVEELMEKLMDDLIEALNRETYEVRPFQGR